MWKQKARDYKQRLEYQLISAVTFHKATTNWKQTQHVANAHRLVRCGRFWSRDKDGGHTIQSATCCTQTSWLYLLLHQSYCRSKFHMAAIGIFALFAPVTLTLTWWPSYTDLACIQYPALDQKWNFYIKAFESYRITDRHTYICHQNYIPPCFAGGQ